MRKILLFLFSLSTISSLAQNHNANNVDKLISDKSFAFISTASFSEKSPTSYNPHQLYYPSDNYTTPFPYYDGKISVPYLSDRMLLVEDRPSMANRMPKNNTNEIPIIYIDNESAFLNYAVLAPKFYELMETKPSDSTSPLTHSNYSVKELKNGKIKVRFSVEDNRSKRQIFLTVLPNGQSDLTLASKSVKYGGWERLYFKGYITENQN